MKRIVFAAFAVLALGAAPAQAQSQFEFGLGGGITQPTGDFGDFAKLGWHGLASVGVTPGTLPVMIGLTGYYGQNKFEVGSTKWKLGGGLAEVRLGFRTEAPFRPYVSLAGGIMNVKAGSASGETDPTVGLGVGFAYHTGNTAAFLEARYLNVIDSGPDLNFLPVTAGLRFSLK